MNFFLHTYDNTSWWIHVKNGIAFVLTLSVFIPIPKNIINVLRMTKRQFNNLSWKKRERAAIIFTLNIKVSCYLHYSFKYLSWPSLPLVHSVYHGTTIMRTGITCKKIPCFIIKKAKVFWSYVKHFWILASVRKCRILISLCK